MKTVLTIAGSDCSGGAGIQADLKTMMAHHVYGMSAITSLTAQNTSGVSAIMDVTPEFLEEQLEAVFQDIFPDAVKIGMVSQKELIFVIKEKLDKYKPKNIVIDPVMISTSGTKLIKEDAICALKEVLIPMADIVTPNIPEAEFLTGISIQTREDMQKAAQQISEKYKVSVLLKGGHSMWDANDLLYEKDYCDWICAPRIQNTNTHGTGCTLSSAIACNLAKETGKKNAVIFAKNYVTKALQANLKLGTGSGPLDHAFAIDGMYELGFTEKR